ncbi:MAG: hypothetical protein K0R78_1762 [Pelosinus sp.]|jgi:hypothetical protein|nr:hypothetical protein [Pelosinus sp.]
MPEGIDLKKLRSFFVQILHLIFFVEVVTKDRSHGYCLVMGSIFCFIHMTILKQER